MDEETIAANNLEFNWYLGNNVAYIDFRVHEATPLFEAADTNDNGILENTEY